MAIDKVKVTHYNADRIPNPYPPGRLPWWKYHKARNALVRTCRKYGPTGPMGERTIIEGNEPQNAIEILQGWERGDPDRVFFVLDDQYNHDRYLYLEFVEASYCSDEWLRDAMTTLAEFPGWGIGVNGIEGGYLLIFESKLMVMGPAFARCKTASQVTAAVRNQSKTSNRHAP